MSTTRRRLGTGPDLPPTPQRDPRAMTAAERAIEGEWVEAPDTTAPTVRTGRRPLGTRGT
ncbi:hypothetical protein AB0B15_42935 [Streptomyces sp. NPDC045456]|uniref:hypothetical protein n=1 Tax=Streptomyces sp. NPDC045456 TaxID=3155254 RepID=UPI0033E7262F